MFTCTGVRALGKSASDNLCCPMCYCLGQESQGKVLAQAAVQSMCRSECAKCVAQAWALPTCTSAPATLPQSCNTGLNFNPTVRSLVEKCLATYRKDPSAVKRAVGC
jgi:hypothetical protein